jgi:hypothetical protein
MDCRVKPSNDDVKNRSRGAFFFVTTGLDPVVHAERRLGKPSRQIQSCFSSAWIADQVRQ